MARGEHALEPEASRPEPDEEDRPPYPRSEPGLRAGGRARPRGRTLAGRGAVVPAVSPRQPLEPARRQAAGGVELGRHRAQHRPRPLRARRLRVRHATTAGRSGSRSRRCRAGSHACRSQFDYADESDRGPYPIPRDAPIEGGSGSDGDRHVIVVDRDRCRLYELYAARPVAGGSRWSAGSGAIWNLRSNRLRPRGWTSADAAGLPILPGLARFEELRRGGIDHALRFTAPRTRRAFVYPARHFASDLTSPELPAMGQRLRLKKSFRTSGFPPQARAVLKALKRYGMILADNGSPWFVSGAPSRAGTTTTCTSCSACTAPTSRSSTPARCRSPAARARVRGDEAASSRTALVRFRTRPRLVSVSAGYPRFATSGEERRVARSRKEVWPWHRATA